jgi:hypothetical protein
MLSRLESMKGEYVKKREQIRNYVGLTDFEKINKERELKLALKKVKEGIADMSGRIDKRMENIGLRINDLGRIKKDYEKRLFEISSALLSLKKGEQIRDSMASRLVGDGLKKALKYKRGLSDGITLCDQIVILAKDRKDALNRSMWMGSTIEEKTVMEKMEIPKSVNYKKDISREF